MTDNVFAPTTGEEKPDFEGITLETLVGDDQKYKTPDELAKAYANADYAISTLKAKEAEREARLKVLEDMLASTTNRNVTPPADPPKQLPPADDGQNQNVDTKDLTTLVQEELSKSREEERRANNINAVAQRLAEHLGSGAKANEYINTKAKALNVPVDWLQDLAAKSPEAFYRTVEFNPTPSTSTPNATVDNGVNTASFNKKSGQRNFSYYQNLLKDNPKMYYSAPIRQQMFNDAREQGNAFYAS